jgi:hypothetical protein
VTARERRTEGPQNFHGAPAEPRGHLDHKVVSPSPVQLAHQFWRAFNEREPSQLDELIAPDYINHAALSGTPPGPAGQT